ncbi:hypothetical protein [Methanothrix sp.]|uniref:hypothetical protein n=1 Tax=Methanothrix sp. TaxID=90426 RepID=UPI0023527A90|nr:hypothetical protein [Methanothrix sp.]
MVQVRGQNNGTQDVVFSPENFVLLDQWGWPYSATAGFDTEVIATGNASQDRVLVGFSGISLQSRPVSLVYGYYTDSPIVIDFNNDYLQLTNEQVYGTAGAQNVSAAQPAGQAVQPIASIPASAPPRPGLLPRERGSNSRPRMIHQRKHQRAMLPPALSSL